MNSTLNTKVIFSSAFVAVRDIKETDNVIYVSETK